MRWIALMKSCIGNLCHFFNTHRMVQEYTENFYVPAAARYRRLRADNIVRAKSLAEWKARVQKEWPNVRIETVDGEAVREILIGSKALAKARVRLGALKPEDVSVELYLGRVNAKGEIMEAAATPMELASNNPDGTYLFEGRAVPSRHSGLQGYTIRVIPRHPDLASPFLPGLITWAK